MQPVGAVDFDEDIFIEEVLQWYINRLQYIIYVHFCYIKVNETLAGPPTVDVRQLKKTFGDKAVVNGLSFQMYENQIFVLLGHNVLYIKSLHYIYSCTDDM